MSFKEDLKNGIDPYKDQIQDLLRYLREYFKNPVVAMQRIPDWEWPVLIGFCVGASAFCGILAGVLSMRITLMITGLLFFPISTLVGALILSGFFYYTFTFVYQRTFGFKEIFTIVALSFLPFFALYTLSGFVSAIKLIGFAISAVLLTVGLSHFTQIDRKKIIKMIGGLYIVYLIFWVAGMISWQQETKEYKKLATPESYEQLSKELSQ